MANKRTIQKDLGNNNIPDKYVRCIKSMNDTYLIVPSKTKTYDLYTLQVLGTTLIFHPVIERKKS